MIYSNILIFIGNYTTLLPLLRILHDSRLPLTGTSEIYNNAVQTVLQTTENKQLTKDTTLSLDLHAFHTSIVPPVKK